MTPIPIKLTLSASNQAHNIGADGVTEAARMHELVTGVDERLPKDRFTVHRNDPRWGLRAIVAESLKAGSVFHLACHSNAMPPAKAGKATGVEGWVRFGDTAGAALAELLLPEAARVMGLPLRRGRQGAAKITTVDCRGHLAEVDGILSKPAVPMSIPALIVEFFFHDNPRDIARYMANRTAVWAAVADVLCKHFNVERGG